MESQLFWFSSVKIYHIVELYLAFASEFSHISTSDEALAANIDEFKQIYEVKVGWLCQIFP